MFTKNDDYGWISTFIQYLNDLVVIIKNLFSSLGKSDDADADADAEA